MWIKADVTFDTDAEAREAERLVREKKLTGISADLGGVTETLEVLALGDDGAPSDWLKTVSAGEIVGGTLLPMPAFGDTRIELNQDGTMTAWILPEGEKTSDRRLIQPDALTWRDPAPLMFSDKTTEAPHDGAVFVGNLSNFRRDIQGPLALVASFTVTPDHFADPMLPAITKPHLEDGWFVGHGAQWGTCHLAFDGCVTPPNTQTAYEIANWKEVENVRGVPIYRHPHGDIHAPLHLTVEEARAWYDEECKLEGLASVGDDTFGLWVSGSASEEIDGMYLSGDWRLVDGNLELMGFLACERPAFPLALVASDVQTALVAAGVVTETKEPDPSHEIIARLARAVVELRASVDELSIDREAQMLIASLV